MNQLKNGTVKNRGAALVLFLLALCGAVSMSSRVPERKQRPQCASLQLDDRGRIFLERCKPELAMNDTAEQEISQFLFKPMNINTAPFEKLLTVRGIGRKIAGRICAFRQKEHIGSIEDLSRIEGIDMAKAKQLEKDFIFTGETP